MILDLIFEYWPVTIAILSALCLLAYKFPKAWSNSVGPIIGFLGFGVLIWMLSAIMTNLHIWTSVADLRYEQQQLLELPAPKRMWDAQKTCVEALIRDAEDKTCDLYGLMDITNNANDAIEQYYFAQGQIEGQRQGIDKAVDHIRSITAGFSDIAVLWLFSFAMMYLGDFLSFMKSLDQRLSDPIDGAGNGKSDVGSNDET